MTQAEPAGPGSVSRVPCTVKLSGKGEVKISLYRHLAPLTVNAILRVLPMDSRVNVQPATACLFSSVRVGVEKPKLAFERGDVAFLASGALLCFFLRSARAEHPLNPIGRVDEGLELLDSLRAGDVARVYETH